MQRSWKLMRKTRGDWGEQGHCPQFPDHASLILRRSLRSKSLAQDNVCSLCSGYVKHLFGLMGLICFQKSFPTVKDVSPMASLEAILSLNVKQDTSQHNKLYATWHFNVVSDGFQTIWDSSGDGQCFLYEFKILIIIVKQRARPIWIYLRNTTTSFTSNKPLTRAVKML